MALFYNVILIDDDPTVNFLNQLWITHANLAEHTIIFTDPEKAFEFIELNYLNKPSQNRSPDLLLLDINMANMSGFELLDKLATFPQMNNKPFHVFLLTSSIARRDIEKAKHYPLSGYLEKPLSDKTIQQIIQVI
ncbi:MAG: response regulator [Bacteroidota bacterium]